MKCVGKHALGLGLGSLVMMTTIAILPSVKSSWLHLSGTVIPNGTRTESSFSKPIKIVSVEGQRWLSRDKHEDASAYHALLILPSVPIRDIGGLSGGDDYSEKLVERWLVQGDKEAEVEI